MFILIASGKLETNPFVIIFGLLNRRFPPFLTPFEIPTKLTGNETVTGLSSNT